MTVTNPKQRFILVAARGGNAEVEGFMSTELVRLGQVTSSSYIADLVLSLAQAEELANDLLTAIREVRGT